MVPTAPLLASGNVAYRFAVGEPDGPRSTTWRLWANRGSDDIYLAARSSAGEFKVSLHKSGIWRYGFTDQDHPLLAAGQDRAAHKWSPPPELVTGWTHAFEISIQDDQLATSWTPSVEASNKSNWFARPGVGRAWNFDLFVTSADVDPEDWPGGSAMGTVPIFRAALESKHMWLLAAEAAVAREVEQGVESVKARMWPEVIAAHETADAFDPRGYIARILEDGCPVFVDIGFDPADRPDATPPRRGALSSRPDGT